MADHRRVFLGNFDFEHELSERPGSGAVAREVRAALSSAWVAIATHDDIVLAPQPLLAGDLQPLVDLGLPLPQFVWDPGAIASHEECRLVPWGWSESPRQFARSYGWSAECLPLDVVRQINRRDFRLALEQEFNVAPPTAAALTSLPDLIEHVQHFGSSETGWVLKANFGMSARERMLGRGAALSTAAARWAEQRLARQGVLVFEPWLERIAEAGVQMQIPESGAPELAGITPLLTDRSGVYRGNYCQRDGCSDLNWDEAVNVAGRVAERVQAMGYFGPLGIDAMWYRDVTGAPQLRPLQDLNARYTMGRLALGFGRVLRDGGCGAWLHLPANSSDALAHVGNTQGDIRIVSTTPASWTSIARHLSWLVLAPSPLRLSEAVEAVLQRVGSAARRL